MAFCFSSISCKNFNKAIEIKMWKAIVTDKATRLIENKLEEITTSIKKKNR